MFPVSIPYTLSMVSTKVNVTWLSLLVVPSCPKLFSPVLYSLPSLVKILECDFPLETCFAFAISTLTGVLKLLVFPVPN